MNMLVKNKIAILAAHLDDFELGMGGTVCKLSKDNDITLIVLCKGDRPGNEHVKDSRLKACQYNTSKLNIKLITHNYSDTKLDTIPQTDLCNILHEHINKIKPTIVYTHYSDDVHNDHRILSNVTRVSCRMRCDSSVQKLYEYTIPGSTEWGFTPDVFDTFVDITSHHDNKLQMISEYQTELRDSPDPISLEMITARDTYYGSVAGFGKAEIFKTIYNRT